MKSPAIYRFRRSELERRIGELIVLLDTIDGDPDVEDDEIEDIDEREYSNAKVSGGIGA